MGPRAVVVLDSNVLVSALGWRGAPHTVYGLCRRGSLKLVTSPPLMNELRRVLLYPKFEFTESEIERFLLDIESHGTIVRPDIELGVITDDPTDDRILECAVAGRAEWIVSGDEHLLALGSYQGVRIGSAGDLLAWLEEH